MAITIKTPDEIEKMRIAGSLAADVLIMITPFIKEGITTNTLDKICHDYIVNQQKAIPAPLHYRGFPKSICTSPNQVVCHGIPNDKPLKNGSIINVDITVIKDGYHGDTSKMFYIGEPSIRAKLLTETTQQCLYQGIKQVRPSASLTSIGKAIQCCAQQYNFSVVHEYCGHGIGAAFHEEPQVLHYDNPIQTILQPGMCFTIEPMINAGQRHVRLNKKDQWTVTTKDRSLSAQWEHTLLVTNKGCEILTHRKDDLLPRVMEY